MKFATFAILATVAAVTLDEQTEIDAEENVELEAEVEAEVEADAEVDAEAEGGGCLTIDDSNDAFGGLMAKEHKLDQAQIYDAFVEWSKVAKHALNPEEYMWLGFEAAATTKGGDMVAGTWNTFLNKVRIAWHLPCPK